MSCLSVGALCLVVGCGSGGTLPGPFGLSLMRGNWLVVGTLPQLGLATPITSTAPQLAMSLDVQSGQIVGAASLLTPCMNNSGILASFVGGATKLVAGTPKSDGTFVLEDALIGSNTVHQFVVRGTLPRSAAEGWSGTYTMTDPDPGCLPQSGEFAAVPVSPVTGTFTGTGALAGSSLPVTLSATLQQGVPGGMSIVGTPLIGENLISGTISVSGSPCFTSGTITPGDGVLHGNYASLTFTMNNGSLMFMSADVADTKTSSLTTTHLAVLGGACDKDDGFFTTTLLKQ